MNKISPDFLARSRDAFASNRGMSLQDLRDRVAERAAGIARRDLLSALDTIARLHELTRIDLRRAYHCRRVGYSPRVSVKHRHDRQNYIPLGKS